MSEIFSFRLSSTNPREARALDILQKRINEGLSLRHVITEGLLALSSLPSSGVEMEDVSIQSMLNLILDLLKKGNHQKSEQFFNQSEDIKTNVLSDQFKASLRQEVKQGLKAPN